jgi:hypothetical protein
MKELIMDDGNKISDFQELKTAARAHHGSIFTKQDDVALKASASMPENIPAVVSDEENKELTRPIEEEEISSAIWSLEPNKAPRPDGFSISFYRSFWNLIKFDLKRMLQYTKRSSKLGGNTNSSFLALTQNKQTLPPFQDFGQYHFAIIHTKLFLKV